jgi:shikimate dehydrogenase
MTSPSRPTYLLGLVGEGISGSLSPALHEREGEACGLRLSYRLIDTAALGLGPADLPAVLDWAQRLGFDGLNVTHPFKQAVLPLVDEVSEDAADLGAVNTVVFRDGRRIGRNTDWSGYAEAFRSALPEALGDRAVVVGTGGAGTAVSYGLLGLGAEHVAVIDTDPRRAAACAERLATRYGADRVRAETDLGRALHGAHGVVNASPVGMHGHPGTAVPGHLLHRDLWVSDVVYFPLETELVRVARSRGCRVVAGGGMAVHQAVGAFQQFTGLAPDATRMRRHFAELTAS